MTPDKQWIAAHIPHQGTMCLLDHVCSWDAQRMVALASSHNSPHHPLRAQGRLGAACGIEYAAQAMAVHSALLATSHPDASASTRPLAGYLAGVRSATLHVARLDDIDEPLQIEVSCVHGDASCILYQFAIRGEHSQRPLLDGRATVIVDTARFHTD